MLFPCPEVCIWFESRGAAPPKYLLPISLRDATALCSQPLPMRLKGPQGKVPCQSHSPNHPQQAVQCWAYIKHFYLMNCP